MSIDKLIEFARSKNASDIHLTVGAATAIRINGKLMRFSGMDDSLVNKTILSMLSADQERKLGDGDDIDFSFSTESGARQRVNVFRQSGKLAASIRLLNETIPSFQDIGLPNYVTDMLTALKGLILVTGATGSGKSTTLATMVDYINEHRQCHILTIEDPIEYRYTPKAATIRQREIGTDVKGFNYALRSALRENPDVILVGEMRDYETIKLALTAAETGHLVLATLHTTGAIQTINRIIDAFPNEEQNQVRLQLSFSLNGVISQCLMPMPEDRGRVAAFEILRNTEAAANLIRSEKVFQLRTVMQAGTKAGMVTLNESLKRLHLEGKISKETAMEYTDDKAELASLI